MLTFKTISNVSERDLVYKMLLEFYGWQGQKTPSRVARFTPCGRG